MAPTMCSPRPVTPGGWPTGFPARRWWCRPAQLISAHSTSSRTSCAGCRLAGLRTGCSRTSVPPTAGLDHLRFQVTVDPLPLLQLRSVRVTRAQHAAEVGHHPGPEFLGLAVLATLPDGDRQIGLADQRVRVIPA